LKGEGEIILKQRRKNQLISDIFKAIPNPYSLEIWKQSRRRAKGNNRKVSLIRISMTQ